MTALTSPHGPPSAPGRILVVDDNEMNRDMLSRRLRKRGYDVATADNGREALDAVEQGDFDLVLLDIMMPEMNGYEALERLKADEASRHIPVVMISAVDEMESVVRCIQLGAADYLPKPFNATLLQARVTSSLAVKRLHDEQRAYTESLARELEIGRRIQLGFLPSVLPVPPGWDLAARFRPAREVAGDFYDAFWIDGEATGDRRLALIVADVCDKGVGAALFMALFRSLLRSSALDRPPALSDANHARHVVHTVNEYIATTHGDANMFATVFLSLLDPASGQLTYVNGGHDPPAVLGAGGVRTRLHPTGPALGLMPGMAFQAREVYLGEGETLLAFTDGVTDAQSPEGHSFTENRMLDAVSTPAASASALLERVDAALALHVREAPAFDDLTLLALRPVTTQRLASPR